MGGLDIFFQDNPDVLTGGGYNGGGDSPADTGTLPGTSGALGGLLDKLQSVGGAVADAYKTYTGLQVEAEKVRASRDIAASQADAARIQAQADAAKLGYRNQAEVARAASDARLAQGGGGAIAGVSVTTLVLIVAVIWFLRKA